MAITQFGRTFWGESYRRLSEASNWGSVSIAIGDTRLGVTFHKKEHNFERGEFGSPAHRESFVQNLSKAFDFSNQICWILNKKKNSTENGWEL